MLQLQLRSLVDIRPQSTKSESTVAVKILTVSYSNKPINIFMTVKTQQGCFPISIHLSPADKFLAAFDVCCGLSGNRFVASLEFD